MFVTRPSKGETEEDLLRLQEEFVRGRSSKGPQTKPPLPAKPPAPPPPAKKKKSIFAMEMEQKMQDRQEHKGKKRSARLMGQNLSIIDGSGLGDPSEVEKIHRESEDFIRNHSKEEIAELVESLKHLKPSLDVIVAKKRAGRVDKIPVQTPVAATLGEVAVIPEADMPIDPKQACRWPHMDVVEGEKMAWMSNLPEAKDLHHSKNNVEARFDFNGTLLAPDAEISVRAALHHHSTEPERAGYSFTDLFILSQSSFPTQKQAALSVFSSILSNYWKGCYDGCFSESLLATLLDNGMMIVLRCALDNTNSFVVSSAISALHALLYSETDEACLDRIFFWDGGSRPFFLFPDTLPRDEEEAGKLKDYEIVQRDAIKGLLRMDILPRLSYLLQAKTLEASEAIWMVEILIRIARHSLTSASQLLDCPGLISRLMSDFLPSHWGQAKTFGGRLAQPYNIPLPQVLKLLRVLAMAGPDLASRLLHSHPTVASSLQVFLTLEADDHKIPDNFSMTIQVEAHRLWQVLAAQGLVPSLLEDLKPFVVPQLRQTLCSPLPTDPKSFKVEYGLALLSVLETIFLRLGCKEEVELYKTLVQELVQKWLWQLSQSTDAVSTTSLALAGRALSLLATLHAIAIRDPRVDTTKAIESLDTLLSGFIAPFLKSRKFSQMVGDLQRRSLLLSTGRCREDPLSLPSVSSVLFKEDAVPLLLEGSAAPMILSVLSSLHRLCSIHQALLAPSLRLILENPLLHTYTVQVMKSKGSNSFYNFIELRILKHLCQMAWATVDCPSALVYQRLALHLPFLAQKSRDPASAILPEQIFNSSLLGKDLVNEVGSLMGLYSTKLLPPETATWPPKPNSLHLWPFLPILELWQQSRQKGFKKPPEMARELGLCVSWVGYLMLHQPSVMKRIPAGASYCLLSLVFLLDEELTQGQLRSALDVCHAQLSRVVDLSGADDYLAGEPSLSLSNFHALYSQLVDNYLNVSYMDEIFARYLCLPLPTSLTARKQLLHPDHIAEIVHYFPLPLNSVGIPLENLLEPPEVDLEMLWRYMDVLSRMEATPEHCPLLLLMAVHHIHQHLTGVSPSPKLLTAATKLPPPNQHLLTHYLPSSPPGFTLAPNST